MNRDVSDPSEPREGRSVGSQTSAGPGGEPADLCHASFSSRQHRVKPGL